MYVITAASCMTRLTSCDVSLSTVIQVNTEDVAAAAAGDVTSSVYLLHTQSRDNVQRVSKQRERE